MIIYKAAKKVIFNLVDNLANLICTLGVIMAIYFAFISSSENANKYLLGSLTVIVVSFAVNYFAAARAEKLDKEKLKPDSFFIFFLSAVYLLAIMASIAYFIIYVLLAKSDDDYYLNIMISAGCVVGSFLFACIIEGIGHRKKDND